jgi:hypothetical protein
MKISKAQLIKIIKEELGRYADMGGNPHADQPHVAALLEMRQKIGTISNDIVDKLGGSVPIQDAQSYLDDAARAVSKAIDQISFSLENEDL